MNFDPVASIYDRLAKGIFGSSIQKIQIDLLPNLPDGSDILLVGGGSGWILEHIWALCPYRRLVFLEDSPNMLRLAQSKISSINLEGEISLKTELLLGREHFLPSFHQYSVIITPFFLDLFSEEELPQIMTSLDLYLKPGGLWLLADFSIEKTICRPIFWLWIKLMYRFFRWTCGLQNQKLASFSSHFLLKDYVLLEERYRFFSFMVAQIYQKGEN